MDAAIEPTKLTFRFEVSVLWPIQSGFSSSDGFARSFSLSGTCVDRDNIDRKNRFNGRKARIHFHARASRDTESDAKHGVQDPCGYMLIRKDVESKYYSEPMVIDIMVDHEVLDRPRSAIEAMSKLDLDPVEQGLSFTLTIASTELSSEDGFDFILPDDLDVSEDRKYPVILFGLYYSKDFPLRATRPRMPRTLPENGAHFDVQLDEVGARMDSYQLRFSSAWMSGRITRAAILRDSEATVEIVEYERDDTNKYADEAFPGTFCFYPESGQLHLTLHFTRRDFDVLIPTILGSPKVGLSVWLSATKVQIAATKEVLQGEVTVYDFSFGGRK
jgi:hypothetical protein